MARASHEDILVHKAGFDPAKKANAIIATSSIRRKSQWLNRYPLHTLVNVRGNVGTRLKKFESEGWDGIIFAKAGLERLNLLPKNFTVLDWMLSAPAQGAIAIVCRSEDEKAFKACRQINHEPTEIRVSVERDFLYHLEGGCSVPISALATIESPSPRERGWGEAESPSPQGEVIHFRGLISSLDGKQEIRTEKKELVANWKKIGREAAAEIRRSSDGKAILEEFRKLNRSPLHGRGAGGEAA
jgi:hydroxymethylbilane synthase